MEEHLLCPEASLANIEPFSAEGYPSTRGAVFECLCSRNRHECAAYTLLPTSNFVKVIGASSHLVWQIYLQKLSSRRPISVLVRRLAPKYIAKFKKWADQLALFQATRPENTNVRNTFISSSARTVSVLHMKSDASRYARKLLGVSFSADEKCLMLGRMTTLQILHHRTLIKDAVPDSREGMGRSPHLLPQRHITVVMHSEPTIESGVGKKYTIQVKYNTKFFVTDKPRFITMHDVLCTEEGLGSSTAHDPVAFSEVAFEFADSLLAKSFVSDLKHAKQLLCLQYLTGQRWGEQLMIRRDLPGDCFIGHLVLSEAEFKLVVDSESGRFRIVLLRGDHTAAVCFDLQRRVLQEGLVRNASIISNSRPAWFMDIDETRIHIVRQESGIDPLLVFSKGYRPSFRIKDGEGGKDSEHFAR
ncbi:hypothetical protein FJTKL_05958 [Diaporthe vaccinii]